MRVLLVVLDSGAPQRHLQGAFCELVGRGHDVYLWALSGPGPLLEDAQAAGCETGFGVGATLPWLPKSTRRLHRVVRAWMPDVVHAHEPVPTIAAALAARPGRPILYHRHHHTGSLRLRVASRLATAFSTATLAVSEAVAASERAVRSSDRVHVVHNGVAPLRPAAPGAVVARRTVLGIAEGDAVLVCVGRLRAEKGQSVLIDALPVVAAGLTQPLHLVLVGDGPERADLGRRAAAVGAHASVHLVGGDADVAGWYAAGDVTVVPSFCEAFGLTAVEAMSLGRPVVASATGGLTEIVDDAVGALVAPANSDALGAAILALLRDPAARTRLGVAGKHRHAAHFTPAAMVDGWERAYASLRTARARSVRVMARWVHDARLFNDMAMIAGSVAARAYGPAVGRVVRPHERFVDVAVPGGRSVRLWGTTDDPVAAAVHWGGVEGHEPPTARTYLALARRAGVVLDVGAYNGWYALLAAAANPAATVVAFEPNPDLIALLRRNIAANPGLHVEVAPCAVGRSRGTSRLHVGGPGLPSSSSLDIAWEGYHRSVEVEVVDLDSFTAERGLHGIDLIKLDVESYEPEVLQGMSRLLAEDRPSIITEVFQGHADVGRRYDDMGDLLGRAGYRFFLLDGATTPVDRLRPSRFDYLLTPEERV